MLELKRPLLPQQCYLFCSENESWVHAFFNAIAQGSAIAQSTFEIAEQRIAQKKNSANSRYPKVRRGGEKVAGTTAALRS